MRSALLFENMAIRMIHQEKVHKNGNTYNALVTPILYQKAVDNHTLGLVNSIGCLTFGTTGIISSGVSKGISALNIATKAMTGIPSYDKSKWPFDMTVEQSDYYVFKCASVIKDSTITTVTNYTIFLDKHPVHSDEPHVQVFELSRCIGAAQGEYWDTDYLRVFRTGWYPQD